MRPGALDAQLREAALRGDTEEARRLVLEGARVWVFEPRVAMVSTLAREAGYEGTADAIEDAMDQAAKRRADRERAALRARCVSAEHVARAAELEAGTATVAITRAASSPYPQTAERFLLWRVERSGGLARVADAWIAAGDIGALQRALPDARWGDCDAMTTETPRWVWARDGGSLLIWKRMTLAARATGAGVAARRLLMWRSRAVAKLDRVKVAISRGWTRHQVIVSGGGRDLCVAARRTLAPIVDPTYDRLMLWADSAWAETLATALGSVTGLPVDIPDDP